MYLYKVTPPSFSMLCCLSKHLAATHTQFCSVLLITTHCAILQIHFLAVRASWLVPRLPPLRRGLSQALSTYRRKSGNEAILGSVWWLMYALCKIQQMRTVKCAPCFKKISVGMYTTVSVYLSVWQVQVVMYIVYLLKIRKLFSSIGCQ